MSEERSQVSLTTVEIETLLSLLDHELEATKHLHELAAKLRGIRARPTAGREGEQRRG